MSDLDKLLRAVHEMTGGLGVKISTSTANGSPEAYRATVTWRVRYRSWSHANGTQSVLSEKREAEGTTVENALGAALLENERIERHLAAVLARKAPPSTDAEAVRVAVLKGYEGEPCPFCLSRKVVRSSNARACDGCKARWAVPS